MARFVLRRFAVGILVALTVVVLSFMLTRLSGDLAISIAGPNATAEDVATIRKNYGLDRPLPVQFVESPRSLLQARDHSGQVRLQFFYRREHAGVVRGLHASADREDDEVQVVRRLDDVENVRRVRLPRFDGSGCPSKRVRLTRCLYGPLMAGGQSLRTTA